MGQEHHSAHSTSASPYPPHCQVTLFSVVLLFPVPKAGQGQKRVALAMAKPSGGMILTPSHSQNPGLVPYSPYLQFLVMNLKNFLPMFFLFISNREIERVRKIQNVLFSNPSKLINVET